MKYRILWNYGSEGRSYHLDGSSGIVEYDTVNEAVHAAVECHNATEFEIVSVMQWRAENYMEE